MRSTFPENLVKLGAKLWISIGIGQTDGQTDIQTKSFIYIDYLSNDYQGIYELMTLEKRLRR